MKTLQSIVANTSIPAAVLGMGACQCMDGGGVQKLRSKGDPFSL